MHPVNGISYQAETAVSVEEFRTALQANINPTLTMKGDS